MSLPLAAVSNTSLSEKKLLCTATSDQLGVLQVDGSGYAVPSSQSGTWSVRETLITSAPFIGQSKVAATGTAVQLAANSLTNGVIVTAKSTNTAAMTVGGASVTNTVDGTGNGYVLEAGASISCAVDNTNRIYFNGTAGDIISFIGC